MTFIASQHRRLTAIALLTATMLVWSLCAGVAHAQGTSNDELKAALVLKLPQYVTFKEGTFAKDNSDLLIGVMGDKDFVSTAKKLYKGQKIQGRRVTLLEADGVEDLAGCHVIYIDTSNGKLSESQSEQLAEYDALTISDQNDFTANGGTVRLYLKDRKYAIEINTDVADRKELVFNSQLLRIATIVGDK